MNFKEHKERTAKDCESIAEMLNNLAKEVREGDIKAFERFFITGGTEEGDAKIMEILERLLLRYAVREQEMDT